MNREDVEFTSEGVTVRGWLYHPTDASGEPPPAVVLAGGWCYVRELVMPYYAEAFADAGIAALVFDYQNLGCLGRRRPSAPRPVAADPRLPERPELPRVARRRRRRAARRVGDLLLRRPRPDPRRHRPASPGDRQPDPGHRRLPQHAPGPRHDGLPQAVGRSSSRTGATATPTRRRGCTSPTPPPSPTATCRRGRSRRPTRRSRCSRSARRRCTRTAARSSRSTCCSTTT